MGTVSTLEEHTATCELTIIPCPNECGDECEIQSFTRKDLDIKQHLQNECPNRKCICKHCGLEDYAEDHYDERCPEKVIPCPNDGCDDEMKRKKLKDHNEECYYFLIPCKYKSLGCDTEPARQDMWAHEEDDKHHLHMAIDMTNTLAELLKEAWHVISTYKVKPIPFTFNIADYTKIDTAYVSPKFYSSSASYMIIVDVFPKGLTAGKGTHVSLRIWFLEGKNREELNYHFEGELTIELLNQLEDKNHFVQTTSVTAENCGSKDYATFFPNSKLGPRTLIISRTMLCISE